MPFVLRHRGTGHIASIPNQKMEALRIVALLEAGRPRGGGIGALLQPRSAADRNRLWRLWGTYKVDHVKARSGSAAQVSDRREVRHAVANTKLWVKLVVLFERTLPARPGPHALSKKAFIRWLKRERLKPGSAVHAAALGNNGAALINVNRGDRWLSDAIAQRKKTQS